MQDEPTATELLKAVVDFLRNDITPEISGHLAFKLRVAINALNLVTRQLALEPGSDATENRKVVAIARDAGLAQGIKRVARGIASPAARPICKRRTMAEHLWATTLAKLAVDQPNYATLSEGDGREVIVPIHRHSGMRHFAQARNHTPCGGYGFRARASRARNDDNNYFPTHFGGRFSENAFGPSI